MAANKYVSLALGKLKEVVASVTTTANGIVAMDSTGRIDVSVLPVGVGVEVVVAPSSENLTAGNFVNLYNNTALNVRKADATTNGKPAHGFVLANVTSPANATVYLISQTNTALSSLTIGSDYWLDTTAGGVTATSPTASGNISQYLGRAISATALVFANQVTVEVA